MITDSKIIKETRDDNIIVHESCPKTNRSASLLDSKKSKISTSFLKTSCSTFISNLSAVTDKLNEDLVKKDCDSIINKHNHIINWANYDAEENKLVIPAEFEEILKFTARGHRQLN